jgi:hypothetical protein
MTPRPAHPPQQPADLPAITAIYAHAVLHGTGTFELEPPDETEMARRRDDVLAKGLPWLVAEERRLHRCWAMPMPTTSGPPGLPLLPRGLDLPAPRGRAARASADCCWPNWWPAARLAGAASDARGDRRRGQRRLDRRAPRLGFEPTACCGRRLEVRPLAGRGADADAVWVQARTAAGRIGCLVIAPPLQDPGHLAGRARRQPRPASLLPARLGHATSGLAASRAHAGRPGGRASHANMGAGRPCWPGLMPLLGLMIVGRPCWRHRLRPDARREVGRPPQPRPPGRATALGPGAGRDHRADAGRRGC